MDRNSAIGLTLIAALLMAYFYWFSPVPPPPTPQRSSVPSEMGAQDSTRKDQQTTIPNDSVLAATYGDLSATMKGQESPLVVENEDLKLTFSNKGGILREVELKKYKTYYQQPLRLITPTNNEFNMVGKYQGKDIDLYQLYYQVDQQKVGDTTQIQFSISLANGSTISHVYKLPAKGYEIVYQLRSKGFSDNLGGDYLSFQWANILKPIEKDLADTRTHSTITYYSEADGFDELSETSTDTETEIFGTPLQWITIKEKFFLSAIIAKQNFSGGEIETAVNESDTSVVKRANAKLFIPLKNIKENNADFKFYFGPNDYQTIGDVAEKFAKNVYLGWPPVYWINKFVIFPVFHFLTKFISNYGVIIIILVILLKLVLFPLSYKSFLSMAKMKVLKPELDEIKERVGEDMTKVQQEQMKLYQQVGVNPISGCIPVLLQMPILFAMFYLFPASIELRQQPFLWAEDLSTYDSLIRLPFTLPFTTSSHISIFTLLMTAATLLYTWQNNQISSVQGPMKTMSYLMPIIFLFVLNSFPSGLTFYYFISTVVTFGQQAIIKRFVDEDKIRAIMEENKKKNAATGGKKSKFMSKLEEAMKASEETRRKSEEERKKRKK
ncbi:membrane protein insertase YidC [Chryseolinea sp. H1M3-3]|uniref:membrane protein insertase YidC n=1 Tax=Chryseolinea sp. H1M3-3 TaxID=3034144 RepID=UPI0023EB526D|nr:membrane protein insertase YidC [Chryseolinea sp. H1M3-3]